MFGFKKSKGSISEFSLQKYVDLHIRVNANNALTALGARTAQGLRSPRGAALFQAPSPSAFRTCDALRNRHAETVSGWEKKGAEREALLAGLCPGLRGGPSLEHSRRRKGASRVQRGSPVPSDAVLSCDRTLSSEHFSSLCKLSQRIRWKDLTPFME